MQRYSLSGLIVQDLVAPMQEVNPWQSRGMGAWTSLLRLGGGFLIHVVGKPGAV